MKKATYVTLLFITSCAGQPARVVNIPLSERVVFMYQSNRQGELEPCGCQAKPYGGIAREANALALERGRSPTVWFVDAGNLFGSEEKRGGLEHLKLKSHALAAMEREMKLDVFGPGAYDFDLGVETLKSLEQESGAKFVATNSDSPFSKLHVGERGGVRYGFLSVREGGGDPDEALDEWVPKAMDESHFVVLLSSLPNRENERLAQKYPGIKLVVGADPRVALDDPFWFSGKTLVVDPHVYGYHLGRLAMDLNLPFTGFYSESTIAENQRRLAQWRKRAEDKKNILAREFVAKIEKEENVARFTGGSPYEHDLVALDEANFGEKNAISTMVEKYREDVRKRALSE